MTISKRRFRRKHRSYTDKTPPLNARNLYEYQRWRRLAIDSGIYSKKPVDVKNPIDEAKMVIQYSYMLLSLRDLSEISYNILKYYVDNLCDAIYTKYTDAENKNKSFNHAVQSLLSEANEIDFVNHL